MLDPSREAEEAALRKAVTLHASFDEKPAADIGGGDLSLHTRYEDEANPGRFVYEKGISGKAFRIAQGKGISGGALECTDVLSRHGRIFFPAAKNIAFRKGGWEGAVSLWLDTDPDALLRTPFCDPVQITERGASNGGIWIDFSDARPRELRFGIFPALAEGEKPIPESDAAAPLVRVKDPGFRAGKWHHLVLTWKGLDSGASDARAECYVDGRLAGEIRGREIKMGWDIEKAGIYIAVNYIGLLDELTVFGRALTPRDVSRLHRRPALAGGSGKSSPRR